MKKNLFILAVAAFALASCSNDDTVAENPTFNESNAISFRTSVNGATRAADITTDNLSQFNVEAFTSGTQTNPYFSNVTFTKDGSTFNSATNYYWPTNALDFYAYSPIDGAPVSSTNQVAKTNFKTFVITPSDEVASQVDFIYANTNNATKANFGQNGVPLNFRHAESKIVIKVKNSEPNMKFEIAGWKVGFVSKSGTFTYADTNTDTQDAAQLAAGDWSLLSTASAATSYSVLTTAPNAVAPSTETAQYLGASALSATTPTEGLNMILVPQTATKAADAYDGTTNTSAPTGSYIALKMVIKNNTTAGETIADATTDGKWAMWPVKFEWAPGKMYTYTIDVADGGYWETNDDETADLDPILENAIIKFVSVTVDNWSAQDITVAPAPAPQP